MKTKSIMMAVVAMTGVLVALTGCNSVCGMKHAESASCDKCNMATMKHPEGCACDKCKMKHDMDSMKADVSSMKMETSSAKSM